MGKKFPPIVQVDEKGNPVGPVEYEVAHPKDIQTQGIRHAVVHVFIFENPSYKRMLVQKRGEVDGSGKYDFSIGAHRAWLLDKNRAETLEETAYRKLQAELFFDRGLPKELNLEEICSFLKQTRANDPEFINLFRGVYPGPFYTNPREVSKASFFEIGSLLDDMAKNPDKFTKTFPISLNKYLEATSRERKLQ